MEKPDTRQSFFLRVWNGLIFRIRPKTKRSVKVGACQSLWFQTLDWRSGCVPAELYALAMNHHLTRSVKFSNGQSFRFRKIFHWNDFWLIWRIPFRGCFGQMAPCSCPDGFVARRRCSRFSDLMAHRSTNDSRFASTNRTQLNPRNDLWSRSDTLSARNSQ